MDLVEALSRMRRSAVGVSDRLPSGGASRNTGSPYTKQLSKNGNGHCKAVSDEEGVGALTVLSARDHSRSGFALGLGHPKKHLC